MTCGEKKHLSSVLHRDGGENPMMRERRKIKGGRGRGRGGGRGLYICCLFLFSDCDSIW